MTQDCVEQIDHLHAISQALLQAAHSENWREVDTLNQQRHEVLEDLAKIQNLDPMVSSAVTASILDQDKQILELANAAVNNVTEQLSTISVKNKISQEYQSFQFVS